MGIINATPDSFSGDGVYNSKELFVKPSDRIKGMVRDGADIIDIGGESSRPGSKPVSVKEEIRRVTPFIKNIAKKIRIPISIDTYKPEVAKAALDNGAVIVNDISGLRFDKKMARLAAKYNAAVVIMHMRGRPRTMQKKLRYRSLIDEIIQYLNESIKRALDAGIDHDSIVIDPGIGFGKTREHNLEIINNLDEFKPLGFPVLIGPSRKSFIGLTLRRKETERLAGTAASVAVCVYKGANIVRVHDVKQMRDVARMVDAIKEG